MFKSFNGVFEYLFERFFCFKCKIDYVEVL